MGIGRIYYNRGGGIIEFIIRDDSGAKIEQRRCSIQDSKAAAEIMKLLEEKYGFKPTINIDNSIKQDKIDWLGKSDILEF